MYKFHEEKNQLLASIRKKIGTQQVPKTKISRQHGPWRISVIHLKNQVYKSYE